MATFPPSSTSSSSPQDWTRWLNHFLADLQQRDLFRTLRSLTPTGNATEVTISSAELYAWARGAAPYAAVGNDQNASTCTLKLFSLNDYLGLSCHPEVRQAAAQAALNYGSGEVYRAVCLLAQGLFLIKALTHKQYTWIRTTTVQARVPLHWSAAIPACIKSWRVVWPG
jgi:7-keto-8-aminopelargonate synthetase-like enzyme